MQSILGAALLEEFHHAQLGDQRLTKRLGQIARALGEQPDASIPQATGSWGQACAAYRFFDHPAVSFPNLLAAHCAQTRRRAAAEAVVLAINDTTSLNYDHRAGTTGLGPIRTRADKTLGLWLHSLLAVNLAGTPLGLLQAECWARNPAAWGSRRRRHQRTTGEKESGRWLRSWSALQQAAREAPAVRFVLVADREADFYDLFVAAAHAPQGPGVLVRAHQERRLARGTRSLWAQVARRPVAGAVTVAVPRRPGQPARQARLTVRFTVVRLRAPQAKWTQPALSLWAIEAQERHPPAGRSPIQWRLLTSVAVGTLAQAVEKLRWYCLRWGIEVFHKVLKSGCAVEAVQLQSAARLQRYLAVKLVIAWRVLALSHGSRERPAAPLGVILGEREWQVLQAWAGQARLGRASRGEPTMRDGGQWLGRLGGHLGRRGDGPPGALRLARGLERLAQIVLGWRLAQGDKQCA